MSIIAAIAGRFASKLMLRGTVVLATAGATTDYESKYVDLRDRLPRMQGVEYDTRKVETIHTLVWHHTATKGQGFASIAQYHAEYKGWPEIAYHYGINYRGVWYHLLDVSKWSYHTAGWNKHAISAVMLGNYDVITPTDEMKASAAELQWDLVSKYNIKKVWLHRDTKPTICPGKHAVEFLRPMQFGPKPQQ